MKNSAIVVLASALCFASAVNAQFVTPGGDRTGDWETRIGVIFNNSSDADFEGGTTADFDSDVSFLIGLGYHFSESLELGGNLSFGQRDYEARIAGDQPGEVFPVKGETESTMLMLDATWNFMPGAFTPFVTAGLGWSWVDTNIATAPPQVGCWWDPWWGYVCTGFQPTRTIDGFAYQLGAGLRYEFSDTFSVNGSYRITWIDFEQAQSTPDFDGFQLSLGWRF